MIDQQQVIGTNATGNLDFMDEENSVLIEVESVTERITSDWSKEMEGHRWVIPSFHSLRKAMRQAIISLTSSSPRKPSPRSSLADRFSLDPVGRLMVTKLEAIVEKAKQDQGKQVNA